MTSAPFSTKAGTLRFLRERVTGARILADRTFTVSEWTAAPEAVLASLADALGPGPWIVRSSRVSEDTAAASHAGSYLSVADVDAAGAQGAIQRVIDSYGDADPADEVLVQPMLQGVLRSGVAFSHDPNTCAPYRTVSWEEGADTSVVTGGSGGRIWQAAAGARSEGPAELAGLIALIDELSGIFSGVPLDLEFAYTADAGAPVLWLLQARPLVLTREAQSAPDQAERLEIVARTVRRGMQPHPYLLGDRNVFGIMPDWNPAEIIGVRPKPLALSLYRNLITDSIWAYQRSNYGYRNLRSFPLMVDFFGLPYVDVRLSFNSFIPSDLDEAIATKLVNLYISRLASAPELHDKIEFEVVFSCYAFDLPEKLAPLTDLGFSADECGQIAESLRRLTNNILNTTSGHFVNDINKLDVLKERHAIVTGADLDPVEKIYWLIEDCKRYGTLPFAGLARAGFISVQILRSLVNVGVLGPADYDLFLRNITSVSSEMFADKQALTPAAFLEKYGHLRPGTYDILSPRYDKAPDVYFDWSSPGPAMETPEPFSLSVAKLKQVRELLQAHQIESDPIELFDFLRKAIEQREWAKFYFTRSVSDALEIIAEYGARHGLSVDEMAYCDIGCFHEFNVGSRDVASELRKSVEQGLARYEETCRISLPPLIVDPDDVWSFHWPEAEPNYITLKTVTAPYVGVDDGAGLEGAIVHIHNADPGYDWLFSKNIAGLVTTWGGANSHMAIRAGELGLPAVIGAGQMLCRKWAAARMLTIDCAGRRVDAIT